MNNLSFFQTSAPDFDDDIKVQIPAQTVIPIIPIKNKAQNEDSISKSKIEYASNIRKTPSNPKKAQLSSKNSINDNKTTFIKPKDSDKNEGKNYEVIYKYGKERTYEIGGEEKPVYEVIEKEDWTHGEIPWSAYVTSVKKGYREMFKEQRAKTKLGKRSNSSAGKLTETNETPKPYFARKPSLKELSFIEKPTSESEVFNYPQQIPQTSPQQSPQRSPQQSPQLQYFKDPTNPNRIISIDHLEKPNFVTQPIENIKETSNLNKPVNNVENPIIVTQPIREESSVTVKSTSSRISSSFLKFFGKEASSVTSKVTAKSDIPKSENTIQQTKQISTSEQKISSSANMSNNTNPPKELSNPILNNPKIDIPPDTNKINQSIISTSAKTNQTKNETPQKFNQTTDISSIKLNTPSKPTPLTPGIQKILVNNFMPLNPIKSIDRELLVTPKRYYKEKEIDEKKAKKELLLDEPKRAKDIFGNKKKSNIDDVKKVSHKALPKHMQTKNLLDAAGSCCHIYYDQEPDVKGIVCCTCCQFTWYRWYKCCSNIVSFPVYCYVCCIIPLIIMMIAAIIILYLLGAKTIGSDLD